MLSSSFAVNKYLHTVASVGFLFTLKLSSVYFRTSDGDWDQIFDLLILKLLCYLPERLIERVGMQEKLHPNGVSRTNFSA